MKRLDLLSIAIVLLILFLIPYSSWAQTCTAAPTASGTSICSGLTASLTATPGNTGTGFTIRWYSAASGGTLLATNTSYTTPVLSTTTTYYAATYNSVSSCEFATRTAVTVTVNPLPGPPATLFPGSRCGSGTVSLSGTPASGGTSLLWYTAATGGSPLGSPATTYVTPSLSVTTTYYVVTLGNNNCLSSPRTSITATINPIPGAPTGTGATGCGSASLVGTPGTNANSIKWYSALTGGTLLATGTSYSATASGTYYITSFNSTTGCESTAARVAVSATVNSIPVPYTTTTPASICGPGSVTISATLGSGGNAMHWYSAATGGTPIATGTSYTTPVISVTTTYYAVTYQTTTGCESSSRVAIAATVLPLPGPPATLFPGSRCGSGTVSLSGTPASGEASLLWYTAATGGGPLGSPSFSYVTPSLSVTTTYYVVTLGNNNCLSSPRTSITATINPIPGAPTGTGATGCGSASLVGTPGTNANSIKWYSALTGGTLLATGTSYSATASGTYYITSFNSTTGCESTAARVAVSATVNSIPVPYTTTTPASICGPGSVTISATLGSGGNAMHWYSAASGGTPIATGTSYTTPVISVTTTYYAVTYQTTTGCESSSRVAINATVLPLPGPPASVTPGAGCLGSGVLLMAQPAAGENSVLWYSLASGGSPLTTPSLSFLTPNLSSTTTYYATTLGVNGCISFPRTPVVATIDAMLCVNWAEQLSYDDNGTLVEDGKIFNDGMGNELQSQARNFAANNTILATQPLYNKFNVAVGSSLPAPIQNSNFYYQSGFISNVGGQPYSPADFDLRTTTNVAGSGEIGYPKPVGTQVGTLGWYYSSLNTTEVNTPTTQFPYSRTYTPEDPDPTQSTSAGPGDYHRMGSTHETRTNRYPIGNTELDHYFALRNYFVSSSTVYSDILNIPKPVSNNPSLFGQSGAYVTNSSPYVVVNCNGNTGTPGTMPINGNITVTPGNWYTFNVKGYKISSQAANLAVTTSSGTNIVWPGPALPTGGSGSEGWTSVSFQVPIGVTAIKLGVLWSQPLLNDPIFISDATLQAKSAIQGYKYLTTDPDGKQAVSFVNNEGQTLATAVVTANNGANPPTLTYDFWAYTYYNDAGQVVATVTPDGVITGNTAKPNFVTTYKYDQLGRLIETSSPDEGTSQFVYSSDGKIRFSQNQEQRNSVPNRFSYTNYDYLSRLIESGEYTQNGSGYFVFEPSSTAIPSSTSILNIVDNVGYTGVTRRKNNLNQTCYSDTTFVEYDYTPSALVLDKLPTDLNHTPQLYLYGRISMTKNANSKTWYSYNEFGQLIWSKQNIIGLGIMTVDYTYDYLGNITQVVYNIGQSDAFFHHYTYDQNQRLLTVNTSKDGSNKTLHAQYFYYLHGPLKRVELATNLQGMDYVYNINGSLKSINSVETLLDPGADHATGAHSGFSPDLFGETLDYYSNDYVGAGYSAASVSGAGLTNNYNGLLKSMSWFTPVDQSNLASKKIYGYTYDNISRFQNAQWGTLTGTVGSYTAAFSPVQAYQEGISGFDKNGNILSLARKDKLGNNAGNFSYLYETNSNRLDKVNDASSGAVQTDYTYNTIGQMTKQVDGTNTMNVSYNAYGLVKEVRDGSNNLIESFGYDDRGDRVIRTVYTNGTASKATYYVHDASGNVLAIYDQLLPSGTVKLYEVPIYGAGRLGMMKPGTPDRYLYELTDHQGNVRAVVGPPHTDVYLATMESEVMTSEDKQFSNIAPRSPWVNGTVTPPAVAGNEAVILNNARIGGPGIVIKVAPGDMISAEVYGYYEGCNNCASTQPLASIVTAVASIFGGASGVAGDPGKIYNAFNSTLISGTGAAAGSGDNTVPAAHLNMIMLDGNMMPDVLNLPNATMALTSAANFAKQKLTISTTTPIPAPGYVYIYVNNNSNSTTPVYFDDLKVTQVHSPFVAGGDFYPFGLAMDDRQIKVEPYQFGYQGQFSEKDSLANWNSFQLRMYEPRYGRWLSPDPAGQFDSPYNGMGNLPNITVDRDGGYIYIATSNYNEILKSLNALYATKSGRKFINKFINNRKVDVYINWGTTRNVSSIENSGGSTTEEYAGGATLNQYMESGSRFNQSPFYDSQNGKIDFSAGGKFGPGTIGIGDFQNFNGKSLAYDGNIDIGFITIRNGASGKRLTSFLGHELGSHIYYLDKGADHLSFYGSGPRVPGLFGMSYPTNSMQAELNKEINTLQSRQIMHQLGVMTISKGLQQLVRSFATEDIIRIATPRYCHIYFD